MSYDSKKEAKKIFWAAVAMACGIPILSFASLVYKAMTAPEGTAQRPAATTPAPAKAPPPAGIAGGPQ